MKIIFSITIILLIGALVAVDAKATDVSKELSELLHQSETDEKVVAEAEDDDGSEEEGDALAKIMMDEIMKGITQSEDGEDDGILASVMGDDEKEATAKLQLIRRIVKRVRRRVRHFFSPYYHKYRHAYRILGYIRRRVCHRHYLRGK